MNLYDQLFGSSQMGFTVPNANSAEIQVHIQAAQAGSSTPQATAQKAISAAEIAQAANPSINKTELITSIIKNEVSAEKVISDAAAIKRQQTISSMINTVKNRLQSFDTLLSTLRELMLNNGMGSQNNYVLTEKMKTSFMKAYEVALQAASVGDTSATYSGSVDAMDVYLKELMNKVLEIKNLVAAKKVENAGAEIVNSQSNESNNFDSLDFNFDQNIAPKITNTKSDFFDSTGQEQVGPEQPKSSIMNINPAVLMVGSALLVMLLKGNK